MENTALLVPKSQPRFTIRSATRRAVRAEMCFAIDKRIQRQITRRLGRGIEQGLIGLVLKSKIYRRTQKHRDERQGKCQFDECLSREIVPVPPLTHGSTCSCSCRPPTNS